MSSTSSGHNAGRTLTLASVVLQRQRRIYSSKCGLVPGLALDGNVRAKINHPTMVTYYQSHESAAMPLNDTKPRCERSRSMPRNSVKQSGFCCCCRCCSMAARLLLLLLLLLLRRMRQPRPRGRQRAVMAQANCNQERDAKSTTGVAIRS